MKDPSGLLHRTLAPLAGLVLGLSTGLLVVDVAARVKLPKLVVASPTAGAVVSGVTKLSAWADAPGLEEVQFHISGAPFGSLITSGACEVQWNTTTVPDGEYTVSALGRDGGGASVYAEPIGVRVANSTADFGIEVDDITDSSARVEWLTSQPATGWVEYGVTADYGESSDETSTPTTTPGVILTDLRRATTYHFRVHSRSPAASVRTSDDFTFVTETDSLILMSLPSGGRPGSPSPGVNTGDTTREERGAVWEAARRTASARAARLDYVPGEVLIKFRPGTTAGRQQRALLALRSRPSIDRLEWSDEMAMLYDVSQPDARILADQLAEQPEVEYAEPNYVLQIRQPQATPSVARAERPGRRWHTPAGDLGLAEVGPGQRRAGIVVAVVDTGVDPSRLAGDRNVVLGQDAGAALDLDGHGTHVASTVLEHTNDVLEAAGLDPIVGIMPVKACFGDGDAQTVPVSAARSSSTSRGGIDCPADTVAKGIRYAVDQGANVISVGFGGPHRSIRLRDAIEYAVERGVFVAIANGDGYQDGNPVNYPAAEATSINGAMSVAAVGRSLGRARYSNSGPHTEIAAPGGDVAVGGVSGLIWQAMLRPRAVNAPAAYSEIGYEGTASAAAQVAAAAALLMSQGVTDPATVESLLAATARDLGLEGTDDDFGAGLLQVGAAIARSRIAR